MFTASLRNALESAYINAFDMMAQPGSIEQAAPPHTITQVSVGFKYAGNNDQEIINAYGIGAAILTFKASQVTPAKFDEVTIDGKKHVLDAVHPIHINGDLVFYRGIAKGNLA